MEHSTEHRTHSASENAISMGHSTEDRADSKTISTKHKPQRTEHRSTCMKHAELYMILQHSTQHSTTPHSTKHSP